jgi:hypothetical protein
MNKNELLGKIDAYVLCKMALSDAFEFEKEIKNNPDLEAQIEIRKMELDDDIDDFVLDKMSPQREATFRKELEDNVWLQEQVTLQKALLEGFELLAEEKALEKFAQWDKELEEETEKQAPKRATLKIVWQSPKRLSIAATIIGFLFFVPYYIKQSKNQTIVNTPKVEVNKEERKEKKNGEDTNGNLVATEIPNPTTAREKPKVRKSRNKKTNEIVVNTPQPNDTTEAVATTEVAEAIPTIDIEPYLGDFDSGERGRMRASNADLDLALQNKQFQKAIDLIAAMNEEEKWENSVSLKLPYLYVYNKDYKAAIPALEGLIATSESEKDKAIWCLVLSKIAQKNGSKSEIIADLDRINQNSTYAGRVPDIKTMLMKIPDK